MPGGQGVAILPHALIRAAAWPIQTVEPFASPRLAALARALLHAEAMIDERREEVASRLGAAVPHVADRDLRRHVLAARRRVHAGVDVLPEAPAVACDTHLKGVLEREAADRRALAERRQAFERSYAEELERQRRSLRESTAEPRFRCALAVANAHLEERWARTAGRPPDKARHRRLETAVFTFLMRAAGRPSPQGCWSGVMPVTPVTGRVSEVDPGVVVRPALPRYAVSPDLRAFASAIGALGRSDRYARRVPQRLDAAFDPGLVPGGPSALGPFELALLDAYGGGEPHRPDAVVSVIAGALGDGPETRRHLELAFDRLAEAGAFTSELRLPPAAPDAWAALEAVAPLLDEEDRRAWLDPLDATRRHCARLAGCLVVHDVAGVRSCLKAVQAERDALCRWAGVSVDVTWPVVQVDLRLPFEASWSPDMVAACSVAVGWAMAFYGSDGLAERFRRASMSDIVASCPAPTPVADLIASGAAGTIRQRAPDDLADSHEGAFWAFRSMDGLSAEVAGRVEQWQRQLEPARTAVSWQWWPGAMPPVVAGPAGSLLLTLVGPASFRVEWGRPQPGIFALRLAEALRPPGAEAPLIGALRDLFQQWQRRGVTAVEVVGSDSPNPNAALGPQVTPRVALAQPGQALLVDVDGATRPWLRDPGDDHRLVPVYNSASSMGLTDPCSRLLLRLAMGHGWELVSGGFLTLPDERSGRHLPRILLPDGTAVAARRWTVPSKALAELRAATAARQYLLWTGIAEELALPELVWARLEPRPDAPRLLFRTDSPLALRCLVERLPPDAERLVLFEPPGDPASWPVRDAGGRSYLAELAVTWYDDRYWDDVLGAADPHTDSAPR